MIVEKIGKEVDKILKFQLFYLLGQENLYNTSILNILPMNILFSKIDNRAQISKKKSIILYLSLFSYIPYLGLLLLLC